MAASLPPLRQFQTDAIEALRQGMREGHRKQLVCAPTGSGKTMLSLAMIAASLARGRRAVFAADRVALINQTSAAAAAVGLGDHGIIQADHPMTDYGKAFQIASVQTLERRQWPAADLIVIDECHTMHGGWVDHVAGNDKAYVIGLSATPFTPGLGKLFTRLVCPTTMAELTKTGTLVPLRVLSGAVPDMAGAKTNARGEWADADAGERGAKIIGDVVAEWQRHASERKTICFASSTAHADELVGQFNAAGVMASSYTMHTAQAERDRLLTEFKKPESVVRVLVSVEALAKGFDQPDVSAVIDCRPLRKSLSTFVQMVGRGLRSAPGKADCILLDHSGNVQRFSADFEDLYHHGVESLDAGEKLDREVRKPDDEEKTAKGCPACGYAPFRSVCMSCGHEVRRAALVEHVAGELREFQRRPAANEVFIGGNLAATSKRDMWAQLCTHVGRRPKPADRQLAHARKLFHTLVGDWPPHGWTFSAPAGSVITPVTAGKLKSLDIAFARARKGRPT